MKRVLIWAWCYVRGTWANIYGVCSVYFRHLYRLSLNSFQRCTRVRGFYHFFLDLCWIIIFSWIYVGYSPSWIWGWKSWGTLIYIFIFDLIGCEHYGVWHWPYICPKVKSVPKDRQFNQKRGRVYPEPEGYCREREREVLWLVVWLPFFIFPYIGNSHPNWLSYFSRGVVQPPTCSPFFHGDVKKIRGLGQLEIQPIAKVIPQLMVDTSPRLNIIPLN